MRLIAALYDNPGIKKPYKEMAAGMLATAGKQGYEIDLHRLTKNPNSREDLATGHYIPRFDDKLRMILGIAEKTGEDIGWIDIDCLIAGRFDEILDDCDFAVPLRKKDWPAQLPIFDAYTNTGIFFFRNKPESLAFLRRWIAFTDKSEYGDQEGMNRLLLEESKFLNEGDVLNVNGCRVKLVSCAAYNNFYFDGSEAAAKIIHFKSQFDRELYEKHLHRIMGASNAV